MELRPGYQRSEVGVIPEDWEVTTVGEEFSIQLGKMLDSEKNVGQLKPFIGNKAVQWGRFDLSDIGEIRLTPRDIERFRLRDGDLLVCEGGEVGRSAVWHDAIDECYYQKALHRLRPLSKCSAGFMQIVLLGFSSTNSLANYVTQTSIAHLPKDKFESVPFALPTLEDERRNIECALSDIDSLIGSLDQLLTKKREIKQGAMQELLTGERRLAPGGNLTSRQIGELSPLQRGSDLPKGKIRQGQFPIVYSNGVLGSHAEWRVKGAGVVTGRSGTIGKVFFVDEDFWPHNTSLWVTDFKGNDPKFVFYLLSHIGLEQFASGSGVPTLNRNDVHDYEVRIPADPDEQIAIANVLTEIDADIIASKAGDGAATQARYDAGASHGEDSAGMNGVGRPERWTQRRVIRLFVDELGYRFLGNWSDRGGNSNTEDELLTSNLLERDYTPAQIAIALHKLHTEAAHPNRSLYENNKAVYSLLRYGVQVRTEAGLPTESVRLIDWEHPGNNDFALAEEVTLKGNLERRPDLVLYVNGIALGVIELKNSRASLADGIRQLLSNQQPAYNAWFFSTVQLVFAGNDSEGLQYGTILTPEKYFLKWKEDEEDDSRFKLDKYLLKMCAKDRLLELAHDFVLFDGGIKKVPRVHQYFGIKAAQERVRLREGGIIWHTQGSGKSIVMVLLAKWILEKNPHARVAVITDRDELDKQIEGVFAEAGEQMVRTTSGRDLMGQLAQARPRLLCSLIHKFGRRDVDDFEFYIRDLENRPTTTMGEVFVFVDECHRTQSGRLHRLMRAIMPHAVFIGFTGTPLLVKDKSTSLEVFGSYIHTYKFNEAVEDKVVLDLIYEARDIDQRLLSEEKIDQWFDAKTRGLNQWQRDELRKKWGTMQAVLSSRARMDRVVSDIIFDFTVKPRLSSERGNAILVVSSIYEACKYFTLFQSTEFRGRSAVITSYNPMAGHVTLEEVGANTETDKQFIYNTYNELLKDVVPESGKTKTETYEDRSKTRFIKEPATMKLLIVVDKLLTGFDAPHCTYLYIDKKMQDHGLFQAICRTNRLDGEDKDFGYIVDYKDLFKRVENAIAVYTSELDHSAGGTSPEVMLQDRLKKGREVLDDALEKLALLCEPVEPPKSELEYIQYFCGNTELEHDLEEREPLRSELYRATAALLRAFANVADEMEGAGYSEIDANRIKQQIDGYLDIRETIRRASGESLDLKAYEADMRHLIDTYIEADVPRKISPFGEIGLLDLIVKTGIADAIKEELGGLKGNKDAIAETIENNVRRKIIKEELNDPAFFETMSALLDEIIVLRRAKAIEYEEYLRRIAELAARVQAGQDDDTPAQVNSPGFRALYNNLNKDLDWAARVDAAVKRVRQDAWRGHTARENAIKAALYKELKDVNEVERIFLIVKGQAEY